MIPAVVEPVFCGRIFGKSHHAQQPILQQLLQPHDSITHSCNFGHLACFGSEIIIVVSNDAVVDRVNPRLKIEQVSYRIAIFKTVHPPKA